MRLGIIHVAHDVAFLLLRLSQIGYRRYIEAPEIIPYDYAGGSSSNSWLWEHCWQPQQPMRHGASKSLHYIPHALAHKDDFSSDDAYDMCDDVVHRGTPSSLTDDTCIRQQQQQQQQMHHVHRASQLSNCTSRAYDDDDNVTNSGPPLYLPNVNCSRVPPDTGTSYQQTGTPGQPCDYNDYNDCDTGRFFVEGIGPFSNYAAATCVAACAVNCASPVHECVQLLRQKWGLQPYSAPAAPLLPTAVDCHYLVDEVAGVVVTEARTAHAPRLELSTCSADGTQDALLAARTS